MVKRIFKSILSVSMLASVISMLVIVTIVCNYYNKQTLSGLKEETEYLAYGIESQGETFLNQVKIQDVRVTWIGEDGKVWFDSEADITKMENHSDREEVVQAWEDGKGESIRYSNTLSKQTIYRAKALSDNSVIRVAKEQKTIFSLFTSMLWPIGIMLLAVFIVSYLFSRKVATHIVRPLNEIDLENGQMKEEYEEVVPLLHRIRNQNKLIKKHMDELKVKQAEFMAITQNMREGFLIIDKELQVLSYNPSAIRLLGGQEWEESKTQNVLVLNRNEKFREAVEQSLLGKNTNRMMEYHEQVYRIVANPVYAKEKLTGCVVVILDETEKEKREALRREFSANVSHELKTPLTSINGIAEIIENGIVKEEDIPQFAKNIREEAGRLIGLINDIIYLSRLDESDSTVKKEEIELVALTKSIKERLGMQSEKMGITWEIHGDYGVIKGVPSMIEEMLYNLCDNAIKYNKKGGTVQVNIENEGCEIKVSVCDTGIGVMEEDYERIFERFYRGDKSHSKEIGGTGLGLSIVKHVAGYHDAKIRIESEIGKGTKITVTFLAA